MNINVLALEFNINSYREFNKFSNKVLPCKNKYPLLNKALFSTAALYFDSFFKTSSQLYPFFEPHLSDKKKLKRFLISTISLNFFYSCFFYFLKLIFLLILKKSSIKFHYDICEIAPNKYRSSDLIIEFIFLRKRYFKLNSKHFSQKILRLLITSTTSPATVFYFYLLSIPLRINSDFIQKFNTINQFYLSNFEKSLRHDLAITSELLSLLNIKKFIHSGWFSVKGSLLFNALNSLQIESTVYAHGHLSQASLAFFYPIESSRIIVLTEEEAIRLKKLNNILGGEKKIINFIIPFSQRNVNKRNLANRKFSKIIVALSSPDYLMDKRIKEKYEYLIKSLLSFNIKVFYRPHPHATLFERRLLSLNNQIPIYNRDIKIIDKKNTLIIGSSSTLLIDAKICKLESIEISDLSVNSSSLIKSLPCYSISEFLENIK